MSVSLLNEWIVRCKLAYDGEAITTGRSNSLLLPVLYDGTRALMNVALNEEARGGALMDCDC